MAENTEEYRDSVAVCRNSLEAAAGEKKFRTGKVSLVFLLLYDLVCGLILQVKWHFYCDFSSNGGIL